MRHFASSRFWARYHELPEAIRELADKNYQRLKSNPRHPSLHLKKIGELWSVRIGEHYRALGVEEAGDITWIWIGTHAGYNKLVS